jgi:hypothetical protein
VVTDIDQTRLLLYVVAYVLPSLQQNPNMKGRVVFRFLPETQFQGAWLNCDPYNMQQHCRLRAPVRNDVNNLCTYWLTTIDCIDKRQTRPLVREGASQRQNSNFGGGGILKLSIYCNIIWGNLSKPFLDNAITNICRIYRPQKRNKIPISRHFCFGFKISKHFSMSDFQRCSFLARILL